MEPATGKMKRGLRAALCLALLVGVVQPAAAAEVQQPAREERQENRQESGPEEWSAGKRGKVILQWDHLDDSNDQEFEDFWAFVSYKQAHFQVWSGEFTDGFQVGGYLKDSRRSTYGAFYRFRDDFDHVLQFDVEQVLKNGFVLATMLRAIRIIPDNTGEDRNQLQFGTGFDWYWGDYNFLTFRAISDPREGGRWSFITGHRFQKTETFYVQPAFIIRTDRSTGWLVRGRYKYFRWLVGDFDQFDFTNVDRTQVSVGIELSY
jgi:opacity protein-like surface antigen